jgi:cell division septal protein FtsQ
MFRKKQKITWAKKEKKRNPFILKVIFNVLLVVFLTAAAYILFFSSYLQINQLFLGGVEELEYEKVVAEINSNLDGRYFKTIPRNNFILISANNLRDDLMGKFKKIESVELEKKFPGTIAVKIKERKALMLWCSGGPCYIVDEGGVAYTGADFESQEIKENNLIRLIDKSARPISLGEKVLNPEFVQFTLGIRNKLSKDLGIIILDEYFTKSAVSEEIQVKVNEGWDIYFNSQLSIDKSISTLKLFLDDKIGSEQRSKLEYADLRIEDKVYYKFKDGENGEENKEEQPSNTVDDKVDGTKKDNKKKKN